MIINPNPAGRHRLPEETSSTSTGRSWVRFAVPAVLGAGVIAAAIVAGGASMGAPAGPQPSVVVDRQTVDTTTTVPTDPTEPTDPTDPTDPPVYGGSTTYNTTITEMVPAGPPPGASPDADANENQAPLPGGAFVLGEPVPQVPEAGSFNLP